MSEHHNHSIHDRHQISASLDKVFVFCIVLNLVFVVVEAIVGLLYNSVGLLSDAGHNLSDVFALLLALFALKMSKVRSNRHFTYGYKRSTILVSLLNAVILLVAVGAIVIESIHAFKNPVPVSGVAIIWTAAVGIVINGFTTWLLMRDSKNDLNVKGAFLHMLMDTLVSVGVVISGIIITYTGYVWVDAAVSWIIAAIILISTFKLLKESLFMSLDSVPSSVNLDNIEKGLKEFPKIEGWHHLHIWAISTTENAATLHIILNNLSDMEEVKQKLKEFFYSEGVSHVTIEFETSESSCKDIKCK